MTTELDRLTDDEVLRATDGGRFGPGIVGKEMHERCLAIMAARGGGAFGPAIMDPDHAAKEAAKRPPRAPKEAAVGVGGPSGEPYEGDPLDLTHPDNPWTYVQLSGAKMLAQKNGVSYKPKTKREELIAALVEAGIAPPPAPSPASLADDED